MRRLRRVLRRHASIRLRLALMSAGLFLVLGSVLIVAFLVVGQSRPTVQTLVNIRPPGGSGVTRTFVQPATGLLLQQAAAINNRLLVVSWVLLLLTALASIPLGWFVSGWMLRPLRQITSRTRTITAGNLHQRLALAGARDEFTELGDTLDELFARLEASFDAQRHFVSNASHELRTPLTVERTLLQVALADPNASAATLRATCEELLASGREQERLLEALLTLASSERGLERQERVDIGAIAETILQTLRPEIEQGALTITSDLEPAVIDGDPALIERLISNLVDNAVRHNVPGGTVTLGTAEVDGRAVLTVSNSGEMIGADEVETIFEPFRRLGTPRTESEAGQHGLGLSIVRAIAVAHGATVAARPRTNGGLQIAVTFPPAATVAAARPAAP